MSCFVPKVQSVTLQQIIRNSWVGELRHDMKVAKKVSCQYLQFRSKVKMHTFSATGVQYLTATRDKMSSGLSLYNFPRANPQSECSMWGRACIAWHMNLLVEFYILLDKITRYLYAGVHTWHVWNVYQIIFNEIKGPC